MKCDVLIVDDDAAMQMLLEVMLTRAGYTTCVVSDGLEAFAVLATREVGLVIVDDQLPMIPGHEVCRTIKQNPVTQLIPVIMHSGSFEMGRVTYHARCGADAYLRKPARSGELIALVGRLLSQPGNAGIWRPYIGESTVGTRQCRVRWY